MEAGKVSANGKIKKVDLIDAMVAAADSAVSDEEVKEMERSACRPAARARACSPPIR